MKRNILLKIGRYPIYWIGGILLVFTILIALSFRLPAQNFQGYLQSIIGSKINSIVPNKSNVLAIPCVLKTIQLVQNQPIINLKIDYCTDFLTPTGLRYSFVYSKLPSPNLTLYNSRLFQGKEYYVNYNSSVFQYPAEIIPYVIYARQKITIHSFDDKTINLSITDNCLNTHPYCNLLPDKNLIEFNKLQVLQNGLIRYYFDPDLFPNNTLKDTYINKVMALDIKSFNFIKTYLGFEPPVENIFIFHFYNPGVNGSSSSGFSIFSKHSPQINQIVIDKLEIGNTHELVHVFLSNVFNLFLNPGKEWFEEGLADYVQDMQKWGNLGTLQCFNNGWQNGYYSNGQYYTNGPLVPYSDFKLSPNNADLNSPLSRSSYYHSGECFWSYLENTYGSDSIKKVAQQLNNLRNNIKPALNKRFIKDIVNPTLNTDLSDFVKNRYNYSETP